MTAIIRSATRWVGELTALRLGELGSRRLATLRIGKSESHCLKIFLKTLQFGESESRRLPGSVSRGVTMVSGGVTIRNFLNLLSIFPN